MAEELNVQKRKDRKKDRRKRVEVGHVIDCGKRSYKIESLLTSGAFGDMYKVHLTTDVERKYAMKTERCDMTNATNRRLVVEVAFYDAIQGDERDIDKTHFARMLKAGTWPSGRTPEYRFTVMELVGPSLYDIRKRIMKGHTSPRTIAEIARQTLRAVESLHELGWLHRDLMPHNFAIGLPPKDTTIFMLDFSVARPYADNEGGIRAPRAKHHWMGTLRYATAGALKAEEPSRKDDIGSWCYIMLEYYWRENLVWNAKEFSEEMELKIREFVFAQPMEMLTKNQLRMPPRFAEILTMTHGLTATSRPDYARMQAVLEEIVKDEKIDMSAPLDWIGKEMPADAERIQLSERPEEPNSGRELQKALAARRKKLEKEIMELYELGGEQMTLEEVREEIRRKHRRRRKRYEEEEDDGSNRSENDYSEDDGRRRRRGKRRERSPHGRLPSPEDSDGRRRRETSRVETREGAMEVGRDKEPDRKKTPEKSDEKDRPEEKKDGKRGGNKEETIKVDKKKEQDRKKNLEKPFEKEKLKEKEKEGKKCGTKEGKPEDAKEKKGEAVAARLPLHKEMKKGRETVKDKKPMDEKKPKEDEKKKPMNGKVEKPGGNTSDSKETPSPAMTPSPTAKKAGKAGAKSSDSKETASPVMTPSPTAKKAADGTKKGAVDKKK